MNSIYRLSTLFHGLYWRLSAFDGSACQNKTWRIWLTSDANRNIFLGNRRWNSNDFCNNLNMKASTVINVVNFSRYILKAWVGRPSDSTSNLLMKKFNKYIILRLLSIAHQLVNNWPSHDWFNYNFISCQLLKFKFIFIVNSWEELRAVLVHNHQSTTCR